MTAWDVLGLEPTRDAIAIKKAYARRLKTARPDDDAQAYQRLREAYDWALAWCAAAPQQQAPDGAAATPPAWPGAMATSDLEPSAADGPPLPEGLPAPHVSPRRLAALSLQVWRQEGDAALLRHGPGLLEALARQPLALHDTSSRAFADLVLGQPGLPAEFVALLARHFGWTTDYQLDRGLGAARANALHHRLHGDANIVRPDPTENWRWLPHKDGPGLLFQLAWAVGMLLFFFRDDWLPWLR